MAKTELELLAEISDKQGVTLAEAKEAKAESAEAKKNYEALIAKVDTLTAEVKAKDGTIGDLEAGVKELKAKGGRIVLSANDKRKIFLGDAIADTIGRHAAEFKAAEQGAKVGNLEVKADADFVAQTPEQKAVGNMSSANLTGTGNNYVSYLDWQPGMEQIGQTRFREIFGTIQSETDFVRFPRANTPVGEGSFQRMQTEGATKPQIDRDYTMIDLTLKPIAGYAIVSRQSLRNIVFLQSWLPTSMMEQLMDQEDTEFANTLVSAATGSTSTTGFTDSTTAIGKLIAYVTRMTASKNKTNFIAVDPIVWANLLTNQVTGAGYNLPNVVTITTDGTVRLLGIPVYPVNWLGGGRILTGDSRKAKIVQSEGLVMRQTDSHASTFITNELTFLLERTEALAIFRPDAFQTAVF